jgi:hypothetical protein
MRAGLFSMALIACGAGSSSVRVETKASLQKVLADAARDERSMRALLRGSVVNGGVWFEDASCTAKFPVGEIEEADFGELARCLVGLKLQPSPREDALGDVVVMTYAPGFEVEARVLQGDAGSALQWIGPSGRRSSDTLLTISGDAFEALRIAGDRDGPLDPKHAATIELDLADPRPPLTAPGVTPPPPRKHALAWLKVCIDEQGGVSSVDPYVTTSSKAQDLFVAAAKGWKFRPFLVSGQPMPVCAMSRLVYPPGAGPMPETLPMPPPPSHAKKRALVLTSSKLLEGKRIAGNINIQPDDRTKSRMASSGKRRVEGTFRVCIDEEGRVESVLPMRSTGFSAYDGVLLGSMRAWRYSPYKVDDQAIPVCTAVTFIFSLDRSYPGSVKR